MVQTRKLDFGEKRSTVNVNARLVDIIKPGVYYGFYVAAQGPPTMFLDITRATDSISVLVTSEGKVITESDDLPGVVEIAANSSGNPRIDIVIAENQHTPNNLPQAYSVVQGTPAASPVAPSAPAYSSVLAHVLVDDGATSISQDKITEQAHEEGQTNLIFQEDTVFEGKAAKINVGTNLNLSIVDGVATIGLDAGFGTTWVQDDDPSSPAGGSHDIEEGDRWYDTSGGAGEIILYIAGSSWAAGGATDWVQWERETHAVEHEAGGNDVIDHSNIFGLLDDDHTQYLYLPGRGGQQIDDHTITLRAPLGSSSLFVLDNNNDGFNSTIRFNENGNQRWEQRMDGGIANNPLIFLDALSGEQALVLQQDADRPFVGIGTPTAYTPTGRLQIETAFSEGVSALTLKTNDEAAGRMSNIRYEGSGGLLATAGVGGYGTSAYAITTGHADRDILLGPDGFGNVGIGTSTSVDYKLDLQADGNVSQSMLRLRDSDDTSQMTVASDGGGNAVLGLYDTGGNADVQLNTNGVSYFRGGDVAVNGNTAYAPLHVHGSSSKAIMMTEGNRLSWADASGNASASIYGNSSDQMIFDLGSGFSEKMRLTGTGLGIGVTPTYKFDVQDNSTTWAARIRNLNNAGHGLHVNAGLSSAQTSFQVNDKNGTQSLYIQGDGSVHTPRIPNAAGTHPLRFNSGTGEISYDASGAVDAHALNGASHTGDLNYTQLDSIVKVSGGGDATTLSRSDHVHTGSDGSSKVTHSNLASIGANDHHDKFDSTDHDAHDHSAAMASVALSELGSRAHSQLTSIGQNDHHTKFDSGDHAAVDHTGLPGVGGGGAWNEVSSNVFSNVSGAGDRWAVLNNIYSDSSKRYAIYRVLGWTYFQGGTPTTAGQFAITFGSGGTIPAIHNSRYRFVDFAAAAWAPYISYTNPTHIPIMIFTDAGGTNLVLNFDIWLYKINDIGGGTDQRMTLRSKVYAHGTAGGFLEKDGVYEAYSEFTLTGTHSSDVAALDRMNIELTSGPTPGSGDLRHGASKGYGIWPWP